MDYELESSYLLQIVASDGVHQSSNMVTVMLNVTNVDDNTLEFESDQYEATVSENSGPGSLNLSIFAVDADDPGAEIEYTLDPLSSSSQDVLFSLEESSGQDHTYMLTNTQPFDYESNQEWFLFNVTASSNQPSSLVRHKAHSAVKIFIKDVNEFKPEFASSHFNLTMPENYVGMVANISATDKDGGDIYGKVEYEILHETQIPCIITPRGEIFNTEPVDAEHGLSTLAMQIEARDGGGLKSTAMVVLEIEDVNDEKPYFLPRNYYISVLENTSVLQEVLKLEARDDDRTEEHRRIKEYRISSSVQQQLPFTINPSGSIKLTRGLDYERGKRTYSFTVTAIDSGGLASEIPARVTVDILNIPDESPTFSQIMYVASVMENSLNGTIITFVQAYSTDSGIVGYKFRASNSYEKLPFSIGAQSGIITVNDTIDYESVQLYEVIVIGYLQEYPDKIATAIVQVQVLNANDHPPVIEHASYHATLVENAPRGTLELTIRASDLDAGNPGLIREFQISSTTGGFYIRDFYQNSSTAVISNLNPFDFEATKSKYFTVRAVDFGSPPQISEPATVTLEILDLNDNAPKFSQDFYSASVVENAVGLALSVYASDQDHGNLTGTVVQYRLHPSSSPLPFNVFNNGSIFISGGIDFEIFVPPQLPRYEFTVTAVDGGGLESRPVQVYIDVKNENDNAPRPLYESDWPVKTVEIEWGATVSAVPIFVLQAQDSDSQDELYFFIEEFDINLPFALSHLKSGEVILQRPLTELTTYNFTVTVQDRHPLFSLPETNSLQWTVSATVFDINDPPYFSSNQLLQILTVPEGDTPSSIPLLQLIAHDDDYPGSLFATIMEYLIAPLGIPVLGSSSPNASQLPFRVTRDGRLLQSGPLNADIQFQYAFSIVAVDGGGLRTTDPIAVTIIVEERNNFAPVFVDAPYSVMVLDSTEVDTVIFEISVTDADVEGPSGDWRCSFIEQSELFSIDSVTCSVYLRESLVGKDLEGTETVLTLKATDRGLPPMSSFTTLTITITPTVVHTFDLQPNVTSLTFIEEGQAIQLLEAFELSEGSEEVSKYTASITLSPGSVHFSPEQFNQLCLKDGNLVNLAHCLENSINLLSSVQTSVLVDLSTQAVAPTAVLTGRAKSFVFSVWIKTSFSTGSRVLLAAYASSSAQNDPVFIIELQSSSISLIFTVGSNRRVTFSLELPRAMNISDGSWHHVLVALSSDQAYLFINGSKINDTTVDLQSVTVPATAYIYLGTTKYNDIPPFSGLVWNTILKFNFDVTNVYPLLSCVLSCGETLSIKTSFLSNTAVSLSPYTLEFSTSVFSEFTSLLQLLSYDNVALEPSTQNREVGIIVSDGQLESNTTITISTQLSNDHTATLRLNLDRIVYYYVGANSKPHTAVLASKLQFTDGDTTQTDYKMNIGLVPPNQRTCDRLDYSVKVKLDECGQTNQTRSVYNLLPISQWGLASLQGVQLFFNSLLGYNFRGAGVLTPDMSIYRDIELTPARFSFLCWVQYSGPGTIVYLRNETQNFLFHVKTNSTMLSLTYSTSIRPSLTLTWKWQPMNELIHVAVVVEDQRIKVCFNGIECSTRELTFISTTSNSFSGLEAYVGAAPTQVVGRYESSFSGTLHGMAVVSDYAVPVDVLSCVVACAEQVTVTMAGSTLGQQLGPATGVNSTGFYALNGSLQVTKDLRQNAVQNVLRHVAYINSHPYPLPGVRLVSFTVHDSSVKVVGSDTARVVVLYHGYRSLNLLRFGRRTVTSSALEAAAGTKVFGSVGITSDSRRNTIDSMLIELSSTPAQSLSCYRSLASTLQNCPPLFQLDAQPLRGTNLQAYFTPRKLLICGLSNITHYQRLLHEVAIKARDTSELVTYSSTMNIRVYISDMNGIAANSKTMTLQVLSSGSSGRRKREVPALPTETLKLVDHSRGMKDEPVRHPVIDSPRYIPLLSMGALILFFLLVLFVTLTLFYRRLNS